MSEQKRKVKDTISPTDIPIIAGLDWFGRTELLLQMEKTGQVERVDISDKPFVKRGIQLESVILDEYEAVTGAELDREDRHLWVRHEKYPWFFGKIDARIRDKVNGKIGVVEAKTTNSWEGWGDAGTDDVPLGYFLQCAGYIAIDNLDFCHLYALNPVSWQYRMYLIVRVEETVTDLITVCKDWRQKHLIELVEPEARLPEDMPLIYGRADDDTVRMATAAEMAHIQEMKEAKVSLKELEAHYDKHKTKLQTTMGNTAMLVGPDRQKVTTWKNQQRKAIDQTRLKKEKPDIAKEFLKTSEFRVMRLY